MKTVSDSLTQTSYLVMPDDANPLQFLRGGRLLDWIDLTSEIAVQRHAGRIGVTVSIDEVVFSRSVKVGEIVTLSSRITRTFGTSLEVYTEVWSESPTAGSARGSGKVKTNEAYLTFVLIDDQGVPCAVPPIQPESEEEKRLHSEALARRQRKGLDE